MKTSGFNEVQIIGVLPDAPNQRRSPDFVSDTLNRDWRFRILCIVDDFTSEALPLIVAPRLAANAWPASWTP